MNHASRIEARAAAWIAHRDGDDWSQALQRELDAWLDESTAHRVAYLRLHAAWQRCDRLRALRASDSALRPVNVASFVPSAPRPRPMGLPAWSYRVAAGVAALSLAVVLVGDPTLPGNEQVFATPLGARVTVSLQDGSKLTLNTSTELRAKIERAERTVWLDNGEAYFDIAHDPSRPFVIVAGKRRVTVVGTKFTLRRDGDRLEVDVVEGRVQLQVRDLSPTLLSRGDKAVGEGNNVLVKSKTDQRAVAAPSWLEGRLVFDQMTIAQAATEFNRYNHKKLVVADPTAAAIRIGGSFEATNVEGFAHLIHSGFGLAVESNDERILISSASR